MRDKRGAAGNRRAGGGPAPGLAPGPLRWLSEYLTVAPERAHEMHVDLAARMAKAQQSRPTQGVLVPPTAGPMRHLPAASARRMHLAGGPIARPLPRRPTPRRQAHAPPPPTLFAGLPFARSTSSSEGLPLTRCISLLDDNDLVGIASHMVRSASNGLLDGPALDRASADPAGRPPPREPAAQLAKSSSTHSPLAQP